jgi:periplasmic protein TonB
LFEQTFIDEPGAGIKAWAIAASFLMQCVFLTGAVVAPLIFNYNPPVADWVRHALLLVPPPPPQPAAPAAVSRPAAPAPARFDSVFEAPTAIPETAALLPNDGRSSLAGLQVPNLGGVRGGAGGDPVLGVTGALQTNLNPPKPLRLGGNVQAAKIVSRASPMYPPEAAEQGISGTVYLEAIITKAGLIRELKVLSGDPVLAASALDAVRQWRYRPTYLNGKPVEVITQVEVIFHISAPPEPSEEKGHRKKKAR